MSSYTLDTCMRDIYSILHLGNAEFEQQGDVCHVVQRKGLVVIIKGVVQVCFFA